MIKSYQNSVTKIRDSASLSLAEMVGHLTAIIIHNKDRFERYPEESRAFFVEVFGNVGGQIAWTNYWRMLTKFKSDIK